MDVYRVIRYNIDMAVTIDEFETLEEAQTFFRLMSRTEHRILILELAPEPILLSETLTKDQGEAPND